VENGFAACEFLREWSNAQALAGLAVFRDLRLIRFSFAALARAFFAVALRLRISSAEYMVPRQFLAPQLQVASSSPPS
jgi:hypothetical protein